MCFFTPRYKQNNYLRQQTNLVPDYVPNQVPDQVPEQVTDQVPEQVTDQVSNQVSNQVSDHEPAVIELPVMEKQEPVVRQPEAEVIQQEEAPVQPKTAQQTQHEPSVGLSAILIENLAKTEGQLARIKEQVDFAKIAVDEFIFKLDSIMQIMDIVRANEVKSASLAEARAVSYKSSKDSVDELLELFQGPVFQKLLRQFLIQIYVPDIGGTKMGRHT